MHALKYQTFGQISLLSICYQKKADDKKTVL